MVTKHDSSYASYVIGILSIVFAATLNPLPGLVLGIVGLFLGKRQKTPLSKKGMKLSIIGLILALIVFLIVILLAGLAIPGTENFPVG